MATPPQVEPALLTLEEYLRTSFHPDVDFVDDHIEERNLGELEHSTLQAFLAAWFINRRKEWNITVTVEYRTRVSASRVRIPDVAVMYKDGVREKVRTTPALLCIEILSPEDRMPRVRQRLEEFPGMGVENVWLFDPEKRIAFTCTSQGLHPVETDRLGISGSPIYLDLPEIFCALDE